MKGKVYKIVECDARTHNNKLMNVNVCINGDNDDNDNKNAIYRPVDARTFIRQKVKRFFLSLNVHSVNGLIDTHYVTVITANIPIHFSAHQHCFGVFGTSDVDHRRTPNGPTQNIAED